LKLVGLVAEFIFDKGSFHIYEHKEQVTGLSMLVRFKNICHRARKTHFNELNEALVGDLKVVSEFLGMNFEPFNASWRQASQVIPWVVRACVPGSTHTCADWLIER
jgi:hypothetical protein